MSALSFAAACGRLRFCSCACVSPSLMVPRWRMASHSTVAVAARDGKHVGISHQHVDIEHTGLPEDTRIAKECINILPHRGRACRSRSRLPAVAPTPTQRRMRSCIWIATAFNFCQLLGCRACSAKARRLNALQCCHDLQSLTRAPAAAS